MLGQLPLSTNFLGSHSRFLYNPALCFPASRPPLTADFPRLKRKNKKLLPTLIAPHPDPYPKIAETPHSKTRTMVDLSSYLWLVPPE